jgi:4-amino-4-deoxy-L-arabinose transferase-like glycosyltransferase
LGAPRPAPESFWRSGEAGAQHVRADLLWLGGLGLLLLGTGIGLRDPWPADEPRFALIAHDMVRSGEWLFPHVGGDLYADKPPLFFWLIAVFYQISGSLRMAFLLPSLLATLGSAALVYDLSRRLWNRETAFAAGWLLLITFQFAWQGRLAQIDAVLCFWTTLSLYGLLRHLLLGPGWGWYALGCAAAGFGVITKGVGFLPLAVLPLYALLHRAGWSSVPGSSTARGAPARLEWRWLWGVLAFAAAVGVWLVPMLVAAQTPELIRYRNEILFTQTVNRYIDPWHHHKPFWYFVAVVMPLMWLPLSALLPWLWPHWRGAWRERNLRVVLPLLWAVCVILFFSASPAKRGVYILPALPAVVLAASPWLPGLFARIGPQRAFAILAGTLVVIPLAAALYFLWIPGQGVRIMAEFGLDPFWPLVAMGTGAATLCALFLARSAVLAYTGCFAAIVVVAAFVINPATNDVRSGAHLVRRLEMAARNSHELGLAGYKEQFLLYLRRPVVNFGHRRWRDAEGEAADAAAWLTAKAGRALLIPASMREPCFAAASSVTLGFAHDTEWLLVSGSAAADCVAAGKPGGVRAYFPDRSARLPRAEAR